jgi:Cu2+-exporting ATPase
VALEWWEGPDWAKPLVVALERESSHPIAAGFRRAFGDLHAPTPSLTNHVIGGGIDGVVDGRTVAVGSPAFVEARAASGSRPPLPPSHLTPVLMAVDDEIVAAAGFGDPVRADARASIEALTRQGWRVGILSGDHPNVVAAVGETLGVAPSACVGGAVPEEKRRIVEEAKRCGTGVMVGDGVNDAAAIAAASVGVGVHGGAEACLSTADVYLTRPGLTPLVTLIDGSARTISVIKRNIAFAIGYNIVGATLAVTGVITPLIAAILMPLSSITVVSASWFSRTFPKERVS